MIARMISEETGMSRRHWAELRFLQEEVSDSILKKKGYFDNKCALTWGCPEREDI